MKFFSPMTFETMTADVADMNARFHTMAEQSKIVADGTAFAVSRLNPVAEAATSSRESVKRVAEQSKDIAAIPADECRSVETVSEAELLQVGGNVEMLLEPAQMP